MENICKKQRAAIKSGLENARFSGSGFHPENQRSGFALAESLLWISLVMALVAGGFSLHRHFQEKIGQSLKEFENEWNKIKI